MLSFWSENLSWTPSEVDYGIVATTVRTLTDMLWYIDGHHRKLSELACEIPMIFKQFTRFNRPEIYPNTRSDIHCPIQMISSLQTISAFFQTSKLDSGTDRPEVSKSIVI